MDFFSGYGWISWMRTRPGTLISALDGATSRALEVKALQNQEQDQHRQHRYDRPRHHHLGVLHVLARQRCKRDGQRVKMAVVEHDQRPHEVVPRTEKCEYCERHENWGEQRHHDLQEDPDLAGTVEARRLEYFVGDGRRMLAHQENAEHAGKPR